MNKIAERSGLLSIILIPISLPFAITALLFSLILFIKEKKHSIFIIKDKLLSVIILSVILSIFLSMLFSIDKSRSALAFLVFILYFFVLFLIKELNKQKVIKALIIGALLASLFAFAQIIFKFTPDIGFKIFGKIPVSISGMAIGLQKTNSLPRLFVMIFPISIIFLLYEENNKWRVISILLLIIGLIVLIPTKPLGAILTFLILLAVSLFLKDWKIGFGFIVLVLTPIFLNPDILVKMIDNLTSYESINIRVNTWIDFVLPAVLRKNFLTGFGVGCYTQAAKTFALSTRIMKNHPHSVYFYILAETGILGFFSIFSLIFNNLISSFKRKEENYIYLGVFFAILGFLLEGLITSYLEYIPIGMITFAVLGLAIPKYEYKKANEL